MPANDIALLVFAGIGFIVTVKFTSETIYWLTFQILSQYEYKKMWDKAVKEFDD